MTELPRNAIRIGNRAFICNYNNKCIEVWEKDNLPEEFVGFWNLIDTITKEADEAKWINPQEELSDNDNAALAYFWYDMKNL